ncbi:DUF421 domain-containing protein [Heliophilum fasciatum]|uniref:Uncharacterized membrane protein YcaP (DUF421 family) n=1 Tax=Heliophilum fasciatum TaxID=35700 RepID=A0A4R2RMJ9_9FIRM|nr:DUF421 domain-containing protein [Heliophilum fasciatum]MCW2277997.1 uncharacterized membrane protein YcaP (DUF421 family) [Heliophilum fasciatum]TCP64383.1 uncharacterized membrane protein YcaP (DUF421 family) [Heliophilum fasciatum]
MPDVLMFLLRTALLFVLVLVITRLIGPRQLTLFDLVTVMVLGVTAAMMTFNPALTLPGGVLLITWAALFMAMQFLAIKFKGVRDWIQGRETILINHGQVLEDKLLEARLTPEDLLSRLRRKDVFNVADVEFAIMEPTGEMSVLLAKENQPVTAKGLGMPVGHASVPQTVILDGEIMDEPLAALGLNRGWLHTELKKAGVAEENVFIAQVDSVGQLYLDLFDDAIALPHPKTKELLFATLKKNQADCELFALSTRHEATKRMYTSAAQTISDVVRDLEPLLKR